MTTNHFNAVLAKNELARQILELPIDPLNINHCYLLNLLGDIEKFIGEANQPSIAEIRTAFRNS